MLGNNLLRFKEDLRYLVLDCETESLSLIKSRPWQISWIIVHNKEIVEKYDLFPFIEDLNVSKDAARITRFDYTHYKTHSKPAREVFDTLKKYLYDPQYYIVGQNFIPFDTYQLKNLANYVGEKIDYSFLTRTYDTLALAKAYRLNLKPSDEDLLNKNKFLTWQYKILNVRKKGLKCSLKALCEEFNIDYFDNFAHEGLYDIERTKLIFEALIKNIEV